MAAARCRQDTNRTHNPPRTLALTPPGLPLTLACAFARSGRSVTCTMASGKTISATAAVCSNTLAATLMTVSGSATCAVARARSFASAASRRW